MARNHRGRLAGNIVDLHARRIFPGVVTWADGIIKSITPTPGRRHAHQIAPGFVDAHIHIESSLLRPAEFAQLAIGHGTVATVSDPHEIANVLGERGVEFMIRDGRGAPVQFNFGAPSCVPATTFETAGATLDETAVARLLARADIRYLSEVMNFPGVLQGAPALRAMIAAARQQGKPVDGHAPGLRGAEAARYAAAGITTDHECVTLAEARDKIAAGMRILIREGSAAKNLTALAPLLRSHPACCMFCCDDLHPDLLVRHHVDAHVRRALAFGADRFDVLRCACVQPVEHYKLELGLLRVGDPADFIVFEGWRRLRVRQTYRRGVLVARDGRALGPPPPRLLRAPNAFRAQPRRPAHFHIPAPHPCPSLHVIDALNGQLITRHARLPARVVAGALIADPSRDLLKIAVVNRYERAAPVALGFVRGFGLRTGAIASSVAHDSHNVVAVGVDDAALGAAVNLVIAARGGLSAVGRGRRKLLPLPIAGLMSDRPGREVARRYTALDAFAKSLGSRLDAPFMTLSFMALLVIPDLKLSDRGLFSATRWGFVPLSEKS